MLTKSVVNNEFKRTSRRNITAEGMALKELRLANHLSMRQLGDMIGKSDSYISHLENGRLDFPHGAALEQILSALGGMKVKSFFERARKCRTRVLQEDLIVRWLRQAGDTEVEAVYELIHP